VGAGPRNQKVPPSHSVATSYAILAAVSAETRNHLDLENVRTFVTRQENPFERAGENVSIDAIAPR